MALYMRRALLHKKSQTILVPEPSVAQIKPENLISVTDPEPEEFPEPEAFPEAPVPPEDLTASGAQEEYDTLLSTWEAQKEAWEEEQANKPPLKKVSLWIPVYHVVKATLDGHDLRIFHTVRGPIIGMVVHETSIEAVVYSPAYVDPNIKEGRVHFLPIAFAGYQLTIHKPCLGESVPDYPICLGYPSYVKQNQQGDYLFRGKGAYHDVAADLDPQASSVSIDTGLRTHMAGALVTADTRQEKEVAQAKAMQKLAAAQETSS
jgi:hypothetical protein